MLSHKIITTIIQGIITTITRKLIKGMMTEDMSVGMTIIDVEDLQVEADTLGIKRIDHIGLFSAILA